MKLWLKYLIGIAVGILLSLVVPYDCAGEDGILSFFVELVIRFGRYIILPLMFFSVTSAVMKLRSEKRILKTLLWTLAVIVSSSLALVIIGLVSALIVKMPHIPITIRKANEIPLLNLKSLVLNIFPMSGFSALLEGACLIPAFVFAVFAGMGCAACKDEVKPAITL
ncbi:MAG: dicarboxylate/amino acid:cation symporter, partial [Treponema sp.]|nr:dicarboxylate/amino acid:cation symporter [Treponema sp.]